MIFNVAHDDVGRSDRHVVTASHTAMTPRITVAVASVQCHPSHRSRPVPAKVIAALDQVSFDGPRGPVSMDKSRHTPLAMRLGQIQADGSVKILQSFPDVDPGAQCPNLK